MKTVLAVLMGLTPVAASAEDFFLQYEGTVSSIEGPALSRPDPYSVGSAIRGVLRIDTDLAPADSDPGDPQRGTYFAGNPDFIFGRSGVGERPRGALSGDSVVVFNDWDPPSPNAPKEDILHVGEGWYRPATTPGTPRLEESFLSINVARGSTFGQLFPDDGLAQTLDVTPEEGTTLWGYLERGVGGLRRVINFTLSRVSLTPGSCRA